MKRLVRVEEKIVSLSEISRSSSLTVGSGDVKDYRETVNMILDYNFGCKSGNRLPDREGNIRTGIVVVETDSLFMDDKTRIDKSLGLFEEWNVAEVALAFRPYKGISTAFSTADSVKADYIKNKRFEHMILCIGIAYCPKGAKASDLEDMVRSTLDNYTSRRLLLCGSIEYVDLPEYIGTIYVMAVD